MRMLYGMSSHELKRGEAMLNFLRKHQRIFFILITAVIVVSFCFFGTYSTLASRDELPDKEIGKGVCGAPIMQKELLALCHLIETSPFDRAAWEKGGMPNLLHNGVIERDFLASGLGAMLAKGYFEELKSDLDLRVKKIHHFRPYVHPHAKQISVEGAWSRFSPSLLEHYRMLKEKSDQSTAETVALLSQLYLDQASLPPDTLKQLLVMQQNQWGVQPDPVLSNSDLTLFGFKSLKDWFGPHFVSLIGQFILNAAQIAEENGYEVKVEEVRSDLFQNIYQGYQQLSRNGHLSPEEADHYYQSKMRSLGLDETMLVSAWKKVMLFRRLFEDGSGSILIDPLAYQQFDQFAEENVRVSLYQLPSSLQLTDFRSMLKFQLYVEAVAADPSRLRKDLTIPKQFASVEQIEKKNPELVAREMELEWCEVSREDLSRSISVKETWDWENGDSHWEMLKTRFPELAQIEAQSPEERLMVLEKLDKKLRVKVDQFARIKMVEEVPDKIKYALELAPVKTSIFGLKMKGASLPFKGIKDTSELMALLEKSTLKNETSNPERDRLNDYTFDGEHHYRIQVVRREDTKKILTFEEAAKDGTLDRLLDNRLEEYYPEARKRHSHHFQQKSGEWKPFNEVKDQIGKYFFADLLHSIEDHYRTYSGILPGKEGDLPLIFYSNARLMPYMHEVQTHLQSDPEDTSWIMTDSENMANTHLSSQWLIEKTEKVIKRCTEVPFSKDEMFSLPLKQWSSVKMGERGVLAFYFVEEKGISSAPPLETIEQGHQILSLDAKKDMMLQILLKIQQKKAIDLSIAIGEG
jgi:GcvH upstream region-like protein